MKLTAILAALVVAQGGLLLMERSTRMTCEELLSDIEFYTEDGLRISLVEKEE